VSAARHSVALVRTDDGREIKVSFRALRPLAKDRAEAAPVKKSLDPVLVCRWASNWGSSALLVQFKAAGRPQYIGVLAFSDRMNRCRHEPAQAPPADREFRPFSMGLRRPASDPLHQKCGRAPIPRRSTPSPQ
jgi:hypothetical protein